MIKIIAIKIVERMLLCAGSHVDVDVAIVKSDENTSANVGHEMFAELAA